MHDITTLDARGIPGCVVASEEFQPAARAQGRSLGFHPEMVWVAHPIQNRTEAELAAIADEAVDRILAACTAGG